MFLYVRFVVYIFCSIFGLLEYVFVSMTSRIETQFDFYVANIRLLISLSLVNMSYSITDTEMIIDCII